MEELGLQSSSLAQLCELVFVVLRANHQRDTALGAPHRGAVFGMLSAASPSSSSAECSRWI